MTSPIFLSSALASEILNNFLWKQYSELGGFILDFLFPFLLFCDYSFLPPRLFIRFSPAKNNSTYFVVDKCFYDNYVLL